MLKNMDTAITPFYQAFTGRFKGILRWHQLDDLWKILRQESSQEWFIYAVGETPPTILCEVY